MKSVQFDISRVIGIWIFDKRESSYKWLPKKQKTFFFGLFKRNRFHSEGFYSHGHYEECYESGCFDATPTTKERLEKIDYIVDKDNKVWYKPYVLVDLESENQYKISFETIEEAKSWANEIEVKSGKNFQSC